MTASKSLVPVAIFIAILSFLVGDRFTKDIDTTNEIDGITFPSTISVPSKQTYVGGGTRTKWGFKVYAVGIYGEPKMISSLKKYSSSSAEKLLKTDAVFSEFSESKGAKTALLRFHREVAAKDVAEALGDALKPRIGGEKADNFQTFIMEMIGADKIVKGSDIYITCKGEKLYASTTGGKDAETISLKGLCPAVFMVYLGDKPVSMQAKEGFAKGLEGLLKK
jgi:hypothetical protein